LDILILASSLAMLSYVIGVIVYALPVPYRPIKKLGMAFIIDAIVAMILITIYNVFIYVGDFILNLLNLTWLDFYRWLVSRTAVLVGVFTGLSYLLSMIKVSQYSFILSPLNLVLTYISLSLSALKIVYFLSTLIFKFRKELVLLGVLLYSLPFRIGKGVGAFLIACSIVLYVGFPLMPAFVSYFEGNIISSGNFGPTTIYGTIVDGAGNYLPYSVLLVYLKKVSSPHAIPSAVILTNDRGKFVLGDGKDIIPKNTTLYLRVEYLGYVFVPQPNEFIAKGFKKNIVLRVNSIIYSAGVALLIPFNYVLLNKFITGNLIDVTLKPISNNKVLSLTLIKYHSTPIYRIAINNKEYICNWSVLSWRGIKLSSCTLNIKLSNDLFNIIIFHESMEPKRPNVNQKRLLLLSGISDLIAGYISLGVSLLYSLIFLPGMYVSLLLAMSAALSRVLGGGIRIKLI